MEIKMLTAREIFDRAKANLLTQNRKAKYGGRCQYRSQAPGGEVLKCAVGCFISDATYTSGIEGALVHDNDIRGYLLESILQSNGVDTNKHHGLLNALRSIHDFNPPAAWKACLNRLEKEYFPG